jgi:hypothetical protein
MDSRKDEQERGITMKSSSIALLHSKGKVYYVSSDFFKLVYNNMHTRKQLMSTVSGIKGPVTKGRERYII